MRAIIQRAKDASVTVDGMVTGRIENGVVVLLGVTHDDTADDVDFIVRKLIHLRIFSDENDKMNLSLMYVGGGFLYISLFKLYSDTKYVSRTRINSSVLT